MMTLIKLTAIISLLCVGIHATTWRKMIFYVPAAWLRKRLPAWLHKPLFSCPICMASVWSLVAFCAFGFPQQWWLFVPIVILMVAGANTIILAIISNIIPDDETE